MQVNKCIKTPPKSSPAARRPPGLLRPHIIHFCERPSSSVCVRARKQSVGSGLSAIKAQRLTSSSPFAKPVVWRCASPAMSYAPAPDAPVAVPIAPAQPHVRKSWRGGLFDCFGAHSTGATPKGWRLMRRAARRRLLRQRLWLLLPSDMGAFRGLRVRAARCFVVEARVRGCGRRTST